MKKIYKIGRDSSNDIIIQDPSKSVSRYHTIIEIIGSKYYLTDNSSNGTWINGQRIEKKLRYEISSADNILLANKIKLDLDFLGSPENNSHIYPAMKFPFKTLLILIALITLTLLFYYSNRKLSQNEVANKYENSVVLVYHEFLFKVQNNQVTRYIGENGIFINPKYAKPFDITGTGFFINSEGYILTNKHIAEPWEEAPGFGLRNEIEPILKKISTNINNLRISGYTVQLGILINGKEIPIKKDTIDEVKLKKQLYPCTIVSSFPNTAIDVSVIKTSNGLLPEKAKTIRINDIMSNTASIRKGDEACIIGFPVGLLVGTIYKDGKYYLEPTLKCGQISQANDQVQFQYDISSTYGASGSPVISRNGGKVIAINYSLLKNDGALINYGVKSDHIYSFLVSLGLL